MSGSSKPPAKDIKQFTSVTGAKRDVAISMLEACAGNVEMAIHMYLDTGAPQQTPTASAAASSSSSQQSTSASSRSRSQAQAASTPMATDDVDDDGVRAPIPVRTEVLVGGPSLIPARRSRNRGPQAGPFVHMRDFQAEGLLNVGGVGPKGSSGTTSKLCHLFRPPTDIMFRGSLDAARAAGSAAGKWILCDIHDQQVFDCQKLNRDLWRHKDVRRILEDSFVFWQVQVDSIDGRRYQQFYSFDECPHIAFIDPRTGERLEFFGFVEHNEFCRRAEDFLSRQALPVAGLESEAHSVPVARSSTGCTELGRNHRHQRAARHVGDGEEATEMASAIAASLAPNGGGGNSSMSSLHTGTSEDSDCSAALTPPSPRRGRSRRAAAAAAQRIISSDEEEDASAGMRTRTRRKRKPSPPRPKAAVTFDGQRSPSPAGRAKRIKKSSASDAAVNSAASALAAASVRDHSVSRSPVSKSRSRHSASSRTPSPVSAAAGNESIDRSVGCPTEQPSRPSPLPDWNGKPGDRIVRVLFRLPDGSRQTCQPPESTTLQSLLQYVESLGFPQSQFSLMTPYPRRQLSDIVPDTSSTLSSIDFFPSVTLCIEEMDTV